MTPAGRGGREDRGAGRGGREDRGRPKRSPGPFVCPVCGDMVPEGSASCPGCGADESTGWKHDASLVGAETHLDDEQYDDFLKEEFDDEPVETKGPSAFGFAMVVLGILAVATILALLTSAKPR